MQAFGQETPDKVQLTAPDVKIRTLRAKLILEEALEAVRALGVIPVWEAAYGHYEVTMDEIEFEDDVFNYNLVEILDALCDLEYVGPAGTSVALGISEELFEKAFKLVHESNMKKLWTEEEVVPQLFESKGYKYFQATFDKRPYLYLVKDKSGKVIKSPSFQKPNLEGLL